jgi:hypothetical protein
MINEKQAVDLVNANIRKTYSDPDYRVYSFTTWEWGWEMSWMPPNNRKIIYGSSSYLVHRNGYMSTYGEIAWKMRADLAATNTVFAAFVKEALDFEATIKYNSSKGVVL